MERRTRLFGFITPEQGGAPLFVHASAFARGDRPSDNRPCVGERVSFEIGQDAQGRKQARHVVRAQAAAPLHRNRLSRAARPRQHRPCRWPLIGLVVLVTLGAWLWAQWPAHRPAPPVPAAQPALASTPSVPLASPYRCDGRTHCSQMTSCAEAKFFLQHCPGTQMDGNHDGVPCEQQWCTSPWAR